jgi:hypothetical protein
MSRADVIDFDISVNGLSEIELEGLTYRLRDELGEIPNTLVSLRDQPAAPDGKKALGWGEIVVAVSASGAAIPTFLLVLKEWLLKQPPRLKIKFKCSDFEFELDGNTASPEIERFLTNLSDRTKEP